MARVPQRILRGKSQRKYHEPSKPCKPTPTMAEAYPSKTNAGMPWPKGRAGIGPVLLEELDSAVVDAHIARQMAADLAARIQKSKEYHERIGSTLWDDSKLPPETRGAKKAAETRGAKKAARKLFAIDAENAALRALIVRGQELDREQNPWFYKMDHGSTATRKRDAPPAPTGGDPSSSRQACTHLAKRGRAATDGPAGGVGP